MGIEDKFIEGLGNLGESVGLSRTVCQIYALLYINPAPISPAQISRRLGVSKGNVSINMKKLEEWNAVKKVWRKGYSRSLYKANEDMESIIFDKLKFGMHKRARLLEESLSEIKKAIKTSDKTVDKKKKEYYSTRVSEIEKFMKHVDFLIQNMDLLKTFLKK